MTHAGIAIRINMARPNLKAEVIALMNRWDLENILQCTPENCYETMKAVAMDFSRILRSSMTWEYSLFADRIDLDNAEIWNEPFSRECRGALSVTFDIGFGIDARSFTDTPPETPDTVTFIVLSAPVRGALAQILNRNFISVRWPAEAGTFNVSGQVLSAAGLYAVAQADADIDEAT